MSDAPSGGRPPDLPGGMAEDERVRQLRDLRALLLGREQRDIAALRAQLDGLELSADELADVLPDAIARRSGRDDQLARALAPTLERAFGESVHRNPMQLADAIYPTLGPAIRKAIAEAISGLVAGINRTMQTSLSARGLRWRFEAWRRGIPFGQLVLQRALVYRVEQVYLIHAQTGLLLAHVSAPDLQAPDADVISGMLTAIRDFASDAFAAQAAGGLRTFSVGDVTMLVEPGPHALIAASVRGQHPPELLTRLQSTLELVHLRFAEPLSAFEGDNAPFEPARPLLAECLETVLDTDQPEKKSAAPRVIWATAAVAVLVLSVLAFRSQRTWNRALTLLSFESGWVTLSADRRWGTWHIHGMRDPAARTPGEVLAAAGMDTTRLRATWGRYISADYSVVERRAAQILAPPPTVRLVVDGDSIVATGSAPTSWIDRAATVPVAGASRVNLTGVLPIVPAEAADAATRLGATRVLFAVGSAEMNGSALRVIEDAARAWQAVRSGVGGGWRVGLIVEGRTDTTGSQEMNRMLSDDRARVVGRALVARGVAEDAILTRGLGTADPLEAATLDERARINRSVTFEIELRRREPPGPTNR